MSRTNHLKHSLQYLPTLIFITLALLPCLMRDAGAKATSSKTDATYAETILQDKPLGYWRLEESSNAVPVLDSSGNGIHLTNSRYTGCCSPPTLGKDGALLNEPSKAFGYSGWGTSTSTPSYDAPYDRLAFTTPFTVETWFRPDVNRVHDDGYWREVLASQSTDGIGYQLGWGGGTEGFVFEVSTKDPLTGAVTVNKVGKPYPLEVGTWYHVVGVYEEAALMVYLNGELLARNTCAGELASHTPQLVISYGRGGEPDFQGRTLEGAHGTIDEVAVYEHSLTAERILSHYQASGRSVAPRLTKLSTNRGGNKGIVRLRILGNYLPGGPVTVKLNATGQPTINGTNATLIDSTQIVANFDLRGSVPGARDVVVTFSDGTTLTMEQAFIVEEGGEAQLWVDIIGRDKMRPGRPQAYYIYYGNRGNAEAYGVPLWITGIPKEVDVKLGFTITPPPQLPGRPVIDYSQVPSFVETATEKFLPLYLPVVRVGESNFLKITLTRPSAGDNIKLKALILPTRYNPPFNREVARVDGVESTEQATGCVNSIVHEAIDITLTVSGADKILECAANVASEGESIQDAIQTEVYNETGISPAFSVTQIVVGAGGVAVSCFEGFTIGKWIGYTQIGLGAINVVAGCWGAIGSAIADIGTILSIDPNDKVGAQGIGPSRYLSGEEPLRYAIYFENKAEATAPAQDVVITDQLDAAKLDFDTFSLGPIAFGKDRQIIPPAGLSEYATDVDLRPAQNLLVRVDARLDKTTGLLTWRFTSLDPATLNPTEDPTAGFLPPNRNAPEGEGQVLFTVRPKNDLANGTEIRNKARIVFDINAPIDTPEWLNTIDSSKPASQTLPLAAQQNSSSFEVKWSGTDTGSGVKSYTIFVSENGGPFTQWLVNTSATSSIFAGQPGRSYAFYSVAQDATGNVEDDAATADATTVTAPLMVQFSSATFNAAEGDAHATVSVIRSGGNTDAVSVNYAVNDGTATQRTDYLLAAGTLHFAAGELNKTFSIPLIDDAYVESSETINLSLANLSAGSLGTPPTAVLTISDNDTGQSTSNPIDEAQFFVRMHYYDFLNREPDEEGIAYWSSQITNCGNNQACVNSRRVSVSAAFFIELEFQNTGSFVYRFYKATYGQRPGYAQFMPDRSRVVGGTNLEAGKQEFADDWVQRPEFLQKYLLGMSGAQFIDAMIQTVQQGSGVDLSGQREALLSDYDSQHSRARIVRLVADNETFKAAEYNRAFVLMQYFGYLRRDPDEAGYEFWVNVLNNREPNNFRGMVCAFLTSTEYQQRFSSVVTRKDNICGSLAP
ncbi:MAG: LamG-like jellyroll fold domain-containing protein [Pyrinomonadaceae bacterium]